MGDEQRRVVGHLVQLKVGSQWEEEEFASLSNLDAVVALEASQCSNLRWGGTFNKIDVEVC